MFLEGLKMMVANGQSDQPGSGLDILGKAFTVEVSDGIFEIQWYTIVKEHFELHLNAVGPNLTRLDGPS